MIKIGITGGIGSGKSTVSNIFKLLHIPVYIADVESKILTEQSDIIRQKLTEAFGNKLYEGGSLNKPMFASVIFNDKEKLALANSIIHPEVDKHFISWTKLHQDKPFVILETAILFESGMNRYTDKVIAVSTPLETRIKFVMKRENVSREKVIERMNSQMPEEEKIKKADYVIYNNEQQSLIQQTMEIVKIYDRRRNI